MRTIEHDYDFVVAGGGLSGICAAVTAARQGVRTALVQDRPVLGGNASTEIRVPPVGAAQCNFAYSRETGLIEELFLNNLYRNYTWSPEGWNLEMESLVRNEPHLDVFLNCAVCDIGNIRAENRIESIKAYCAMAETLHVFKAPYFADCTGDGVIGALAGAIYRIGVEARSEFNESMCPEKSSNEVMGMSLHMHARDAHRPMPFTRPGWVNMELGKDDFGPYRPVCEHFFPDTGGFWWLEWGGELDTIHDTLKIKDEVQKITLAVWDFLKNRSSLAEQLTTYELDWVGAVPAKRESRRFEGDHILTMNDIDQQVDFKDAVAYGGWGFDHHPAGGFYDKVNPSTHQYLRGPHNVPLRSLYSRNIHNIFFAGRNISVSHYALSNTRVMMTCAQLGEAVGVAAAEAVSSRQKPADLVTGEPIRRIQENLMRRDHHLHGLEICIRNDIAPAARVSASSTFSNADILNSTSWGTDLLSRPRMLMLPVATAELKCLKLRIDASKAATLSYAFYQGPKTGSTYPDELLLEDSVAISKGDNQEIEVPLNVAISRPGWHFLSIKPNEYVRIHVAEAPVGMRRYIPKPEDPIRPNPFSKWTSRSLPIGMTREIGCQGALIEQNEWSEYAYQFVDMSAFLNIAHICAAIPEQPVYQPSMVTNPHSRPTNMPNLWVSAPSTFKKPEWLELTWDRPRDITGVQVLFDSALHFHFWQSWQGYKTRAIPSIVKSYRFVARLTDGSQTILADVTDNFQRNRRHTTALKGVVSLRLEILATNGLERAQVYSIRVFS
jgi:hypothetical protein